MYTVEELNGCRDKKMHTRPVVEFVVAGAGAGCATPGFSERKKKKKKRKKEKKKKKVNGVTCQTLFRHQGTKFQSHVMYCSVSW